MTMILTTTLTVDFDYVRDIQRERFFTPMRLLLLKLVSAKTEMKLLLKRARVFWNVNRKSIGNMAESFMKQWLLT